MAPSTGWRIATVLLVLTAAGCGRGGENHSPQGVRETLTSSLEVPGSGVRLEAALASPLDGSLNVPRDAVARVVFSEPAAHPEEAALLGPEGPVPVDRETDATGRQITLRPHAPLEAATTYRVLVGAGTPSDGEAFLARERVWEFTTAATDGAPVITPLPPAGADGVWSAGAWVDPLGAAVEVALATDNNADGLFWRIERPTGLFAAPTPLTPHAPHRLRVTVTPRNAGVGAEAELPIMVGWADVSPAGLSARLHDVALLTALWAFAAGDDGTLIETDDGGLSWRTVATGTHADLFALDFITPRIGWAVGAEGTLLGTTDGATWHPRSLGTAADLRDIAFVGASHGIAVGDGGTVLVTGDGGKTWKVSPTPTTARLNRVECESAPTCLVVGDNGTILVTKDSGATWERQPTETGADLFGIASTTDGYRWVVGEGGIVLVSGGGSEGWVVRGATGQAAMRDVAFGNALEGWAAGSGNFLIHTADGGLSWRAQMLPASVRVRTLAARGNHRLMAVGETLATGAPWVMATDTGGAP